MKPTLFTAAGSVVACFLVIVLIAVVTDAVAATSAPLPAAWGPARPYVVTGGKAPTPGHRAIPYPHGPFPTYTPTPPPFYTSTPTPTCPPSWAYVPSPNNGSDNNILTSISAVTENDVWAVGYYSNAGDIQPLTMHWAGSQWSIVSAPAPGPISILTGVSARAHDDVWAVGSYSSSSGPVLITMHSNGTSWTQMPSPHPGAGYGEYLRAVDALAPNDVWAVGLYWSNGSLAWSLIMHWTGSEWQVMPPPGGAELRGVDAIAANDVWAVGRQFDTAATSQTYHWNGTAWTAVPSPNVGILNSVSGTATDDVWAVGNSGILHWDGTAWSVVFDPTGWQLNDVLALTRHDAWAVGPDIIHWDGTGWRIVGYPRPGSPSEFMGIATEPGGGMWAAGGYQSALVSRTLTEHRGVCGPTFPTPTPTNTTTATYSPTPTGTEVVTDTPTNTPTETQTAGSPTVTPTPCAITFTDVNPPDYFYEAVMYLACHGVVTGYSDGTFRPYNDTTRGQLSKIVVLAEGWPIVTPTGTPTFQDLPPDNPFYGYIETAYSQGIISGYSCGVGCLEFRWANNITRGQLTKVVVLAMNWAITPPSTPTFVDVPLDHPFYGYIETAYAHQIISGYSCGADCLEFRPYNNATRGQIAKIVYNAISGP